MFLETGLQDFSIVKLVCVYVYVRVCVGVGGVKKTMTQGSGKDRR